MRRPFLYRKIWLALKIIRENEKRRQLIAKMLASFAVTAVVVVTVVIAGQKPVTADFLSVSALGNEIIYRIDVQDPDSRIAGDTLQLEVKGNAEKYFAPLSIGETSGSQIVFGSSTNYTLTISADLGFGRETLDSESIQIANSLAGAILDVRLDPALNPSEESDVLTYLVDTKYYDPESKIGSAWGVQTPTLLAGAGILGLALSFGAQSLIEDVIAGLFIIFEKQFQVGDIIQAHSFRGKVTEIGVRTTTLVDVNGDVLIINNSDLRQTINTSANLSPAICDISIAYGEDLERVEKVILSNIEGLRKKIPISSRDHSIAVFSRWPILRSSSRCMPELTN